jgi:hypothetical protein
MPSAWDCRPPISRRALGGNFRIAAFAGQMYMSLMMGGGVPDDSEAGLRDTISEAMGNTAKAAMDSLAKKK